MCLKYNSPCFHLVVFSEEFNVFYIGFEKNKNKYSSLIHHTTANIVSLFKKFPSQKPIIHCKRPKFRVSKEEKK